MFMLFLVDLFIIVQLLCWIDFDFLSTSADVVEMLEILTAYYYLTV